MLNCTARKASLTLVALATLSSNAIALDIARWSFPNVIASPYNTPPASTVLTMASATELGMTNNYNGGNTAGCDVTNTTGNPNPLGTQRAWRVRGAPNNGWAIAAPQYTQGAEFRVSTLGYMGVKLSFDWFCTTQGVRNLQVQYNLNVNNAGGWTNFAGNFLGNIETVKDAANNTLLVGARDNWNTVGKTANSNVVDFAANGIGGVDNNANFGVRLVSAWDPAQGTYGSASAPGVPYNNTSGNWRFDQIAVIGEPVPEPATLLALGLGATSLLRRRKK